MNTNHYRDIVPAWQVELINRRARQRGFRQDELADLQQRIVPHLAAFRFDPERSEGAVPRTAVVALIDQQLKAAARASARYRRHVHRCEQVGCLRSQIVSDHNIPRALDVREAVRLLPPREQAVCAGLAAGASLADIAARLQCSWHVVRRLVANIRRQFEKLGLHAWLGT